MNAFIEKQNRSLIEDFTSTGSCLIAINSENLQRRVDLDGWVIEHLPGCRPKNAFILRKSKEAHPELWVRWDFSGYRRAFYRYLQHCHPELVPCLDSKVHVDHLEPRIHFNKRCRYFVRLHLVDQRTNSSYGAGYERRFHQMERARSSVMVETWPGAMYMTWLAFCKASCIALPGKRSGKHSWKHWADEVASHVVARNNEPFEFVRDGLLRALRLGYTGYWHEKVEYNND